MTWEFEQSFTTAIDTSSSIYFTNKQGNVKLNKVGGISVYTNTDGWKVNAILYTDDTIPVPLSSSLLPTINEQARPMISDDGNTFIIGAPTHTGEAGVYIFRKVGTTYVADPVLMLSTLINPITSLPTTFTDALFGTEYSLSGDGNIMFVKGDVWYICYNHLGIWYYGGLLTADFSSASYDGSYIITKDGTDVYWYKRNLNHWQYKGTLGATAEAGVEDTKISHNATSVILYKDTITIYSLFGNAFKKQSELTSEKEDTNNTILKWDGNKAWYISATKNGVVGCALDFWTGKNNDFDLHSSDAFNVEQITHRSYERLDYGYYFNNGDFTNRQTTVEAVPRRGFSWFSVYPYFDSMYVLHGLDILRYESETGSYVGIIATMPSIILNTTSADCSGEVSNQYLQMTPHSNMVITNNKIFITAKQQDLTDQQYLCIYDMGTQIWTTTILPGRAQYIKKRNVVDGLDGFVWITNINNHAIIKVNTTTDTVVATLRVNRHPYKMTSNQNKQLFVASNANSEKVKRRFQNADLANGLSASGTGDTAGIVAPSNIPFSVMKTSDITQGMVSLIDQQANTQSAFCGGRCDKLGEFHDDGNGHLWFTTDLHFGRVNKSTKYITTTWKNEGESTDLKETLPELETIPDNASLSETKSTIQWSKDHKTIPGGISTSLVTPQFTYQRWNGTSFVNTTVLPYLIMVVDGQFLTYRLSALVRKNIYKVRGTSMIAVGEQAYIGDIE